jgi:hypothetical protein
MTARIYAYRFAVCKITVLLVLLTSTVPASSSWSYAAQGSDVYDITPASGAPGREYLVNIISHNQAIKKITATTQIVAPGGIAVSDVKMVFDYAITARIAIPKDTPLGKTQFFLKDKEEPGGTIIGIADFEVIAVAQGAIPPGLDPQVDVMWGVMSDKVVMHNFGHKIAKHYYGIQLSIGNNTGYDLQIASVGFRLPTNSHIKNIVPTNSYRATRGTLERAQEIGTRAKVLNSVKAAGLLLTGALPFWHALGPRENAAIFADLFNGPLVGGLELVYPDTIISQLTRLDDQMLRDGLIVKNNSQARTLVFVPKQLLDISKDEGFDDHQDFIRFNSDKKKNKKFDFRNDPQYVNLRLGDLVLIGQPIQFLNRIQVIKSAEGGPVTPPPTVAGVNPSLFQQGADHEALTIPGAYLDDAVLTPKDPDTNETVPGIRFSNTAADPSGHILESKVTVANNVMPKKYQLVISSPGGSVEKTFEIIQKAPSVLKLIYVDGHQPTANTSDNTDVKIRITGKDLENARILVPAESRGKLELKPDAKVEDGELTQTIRVLKGTPKGTYKLQIRNTNPMLVDLEFVVAAPTPP